MFKWLLFFVCLSSARLFNQESIQITPKLIKSIQALSLTQKDVPSWTQCIGSVPILISAPHACPVIREAHGKKETHKFADIGTGQLAMLLHQACDVSIMFLSTDSDNDPNSSHTSDYQQELAKMIQKIQPKLVIDLHRAHEYRAFDVDIGTLYGKSCPIDLVIQLENVLKTHGIYSISSNTFSASKKDTVTKLSYHMGYPSMQLEINGVWLDYNKESYAVHRFAKIAQAMIDFINAYIAQSNQ